MNTAFPNPVRPLFGSALRDDSARRGFIDSGDPPPAPTPKPEKPKAATKTGR